LLLKKKSKKEEKNNRHTLYTITLLSMCSITLRALRVIYNGRDAHESTVIQYTIYNLALIEHFLTSNIKYDIIGKIIAEV